MRTIFITSFHPFISRNILQTDLIERLKQNDYRAVILAPDYKKDYFQKEFGGAGIFIEGVSAKLNRRDLFFRSLALAFSPTRTLFIKKRSDFFEDKKLTRYILAAGPAAIFGRNRFIIKLLRLLDRVFYSRSDIFAELFDGYQPDLVFATDIQNEFDVRLIHGARNRGIKSIGMTRSWDNVTSKGLLRAVPDELIVQNDIIKKELEYWNFIPAGKISVVGIPHYDRYFRTRLLQSEKSAFFKRHGFDPKKKMIFFAPAGNRYVRHNETDKFFLEALSNFDVNIMARIPPGDNVNFGDFQSRKAKIIFEEPGARFWRGGRKLNEISKADDANLINDLLYSDLVVTHLASMCVDAAFFNKPVIIMGFDPQPRPYWDSIRRYFDYDHLGPIIKSGGVMIASQPDDLAVLVSRYLDDPTRDRLGRQRIVSEQVQFLDGQATQRLAARIKAYGF